MDATKIKIGSVGFGQVNGYPPTHWRLEGRRYRVWVLTHVKPAAQSRSYPDQYVDWATVERLMASGD